VNINFCLFRSPVSLLSSDFKNKIKNKAFRYNKIMLRFKLVICPYSNAMKYLTVRPVYISRCLLYSTACEEEGATASCAKTPSELPFQIQVTYTDLEGGKAMRVLTCVQPVTRDRAEAESRM